MHQKTCFKCDTVKPYSEFYKHPRMADGHLGKCKCCTRRDTAEREERMNKDLTWKEKELARHREKSTKARELGKLPSKEAQRRGSKAWSARNKEKKYAHGKVAFALRIGSLVRQPCEVCGELRVQAHHDDYGKPLEVRWLCVTHHAEHHLNEKKIIRLKHYESLNQHL